MSAKNTLVGAAIAAAMAGGSSLLFLALVAVGDRLVIRKVAPLEHLFPPHARFEYDTPEFHFVATTNRLGLRDREVDRLRAPGFRIVAIGDSFTFGWGVALEDSWPKLLEAHLRADGFSAEVLNAGRGGYGPADYVRVAEQVIPRLEPDLVLVGVLQGDDLAQSLSSTPATPPDVVGPSPWLWEGARAALRWICPNLLRWRRGWARASDPKDSGAVWREQVRERLAKLTADERQVYARVDAAARDLYEGGGLNPGLLFLALRQPEYFSLSEREDESAQAHERELAKHLRRIRDLTVAHGTRLLVVSIPNGIYTSARALETRGKLGFHVDESFLASSAPDDVIRRACRASGTAFVTVLSQFRSLGDEEELYYEWDGHFTSLGNLRFAKLLTPAVEMEIGRARLTGSPRTDVPGEAPLPPPPRTSSPRLSRAKPPEQEPTGAHLSGARSPDDGRRREETGAGS